MNLAGLPEHAADLDRFRRALQQWQDAFGDLGLIPEDDLLEQWRSGGVWSVTATPEVSVTGGGVTAACTTDGARIVWTADPPPEGQPIRPATGADPMRSPANEIGSPPVDGRRWYLLCAATPPTADSVWIKACRLGYLDSAEVLVQLPTGS